MGAFAASFSGDACGHAAVQKRVDNNAVSRMLRRIILHLHRGFPRLRKRRRLQAART